MAGRKWDAHYEADGFEWMRRDEHDGKQVTLEGIGIGELAHVRARWSVTPNSPEVPPGHVGVQRVWADGQQASRGVTSSVLRDAERVLVRMTAAMPAQTSGLSLADPMDDIRTRARALPSGPRAHESYYGQLLALYNAILRLQVSNPVKVLCEVTGRPEGTVKLHLRKARQEADA